MGSVYSYRLMTITRRSFFLFRYARQPAALGQNQGIATRDLKAQARPAPSGRPFNAHFDVAHEAGLRVCHLRRRGREEIHSEANGCGCAFIDYDNYGWMDVFLLGYAPEAIPEATNRLYKQSRRAHRRH